MRVIATVIAALILLSIFYIMAVGAQVFVNDYVSPQKMFLNLFATTLITGLASSMIYVKIPN
jgi:succinate dehydrogenase hydrophobic anchor subunit